MRSTLWSIRAWWERWRARDKACCGRCRRPYERVPPHHVQFAVGAMVRIMCKKCWSESGTQERLRVAKAMWLGWQADDAAKKVPDGKVVLPWEILHAAVAYERQAVEVPTVAAGMCVVARDPGRYRYITSDGKTIFVVPELPPELIEAWEEYQP